MPFICAELALESTIAGRPIQTIVRKAEVA
jgi:hypothetical protein